MQCEFFGPISGLNFVEGEFWEVNFSRVNFSGGLFRWKKQSQKIRPKNSGPKFGRPKFVSQNSGLNSGSGGANSPVQTSVRDIFMLILKHTFGGSLKRTSENLNEF